MIGQAALEFAIWYLRNWPIPEAFLSYAPLLAIIMLYLISFIVGNAILHQGDLPAAMKKSKTVFISVLLCGFSILHMGVWTLKLQAIGKHVHALTTSLDSFDNELVQLCVAMRIHERGMRNASTDDARLQALAWTVMWWRQSGLTDVLQLSNTMEAVRGELAQLQQALPDHFQKLLSLHQVGSDEARLDGPFMEARAARLVPRVEAVLLAKVQFLAGEATNLATEFDKQIVSLYALPASAPACALTTSTALTAAAAIAAAESKANHPAAGSWRFPSVAIRLEPGPEPGRSGRATCGAVPR